MQKFYYFLRPNQTDLSMSFKFRALQVNETTDGVFQRQIIERHTDALPEGDVLIRVHYSALNYKDALSATGHKGVTRNYPHTPGIDAAGTVVESNHEKWRPGDEVIVTSYDLGMNTAGGFGQYIRVPAEWIIALPAGLSLRESMIIGTAGLTAGIGLYKMERLGQQPADGPLVVTGATGGVGSLAIGILSRAGYEVIAATGQKTAASYLRRLGAARIVDRSFVNDTSGRPLLRTQWAGAIDTVGGNTLATLLKGCRREGCIAACGLVASADLPTTVYPFILNGVNLLGIDSATFAASDRLAIWRRLATDWRPAGLEEMANECDLNGLNDYIDKILAGHTMGRVIVNLQK